MAFNKSTAKRDLFQVTHSALHNWRYIMRNIKTSVKNNILTIQVKLDAKTKPSASGKTLIIASSQGNKSLEDCDGVVMGLNIYKYKDSK